MDPTQTKALGVIDLFVLAAYLGLTLFVGLLVGRRSRSTDQFTVGGGQIPGWAVGLSVFGTYVSSISFLALPGKAYETGWLPFAFSLSIPLAAWVAARWFVPFYRSQETVSAYTHLEERIGPWARYYAVVCFLFTQIFRIGTILYLVALAVEPIVGISLKVLILVLGLSVLVYSAVGGMRSVVWTDALQSVVLMAGALICAAILFFGLPGGPGRVVELGMAFGKWTMGPYRFSLVEETFWVVLIYGVVTNLQNFGVDQNYVQRYHTASSLKEARKSVCIGGLLYVPVSALFLLIGVALFAWYHGQGHPVELVNWLDSKPDRAFPHFIANQLPPGISGLVVAAIIAAAQSTISSSVNSSATLIFYDVVPRWQRLDADWQLKLLRVATILCGLAGIVVALAMIRARSALDVWWRGASVLGGGVLGLFLLGLLFRKVRSSWALVGLGCGLIAIFLMVVPEVLGFLLSPLWPPYLNNLALGSLRLAHPYLANGVGTITILLVGLIGSFAGGKDDKKRV